MQKFFNFALGALVGALVGSALALLLAPASGVEVQNQVRSRVQDLIEEGRRAAAARRVELERQLEAFKQGETKTSKVNVKLQ
ncbi:MAG TPA: hypothetical protein ENN19_04320 [Chloroflexi bacterium]|nr:hypothetical protein [Chloroflexota bacterium]